MAVAGGAGRPSRSPGARNARASDCRANVGDGANPVLTRQGLSPRFGAPERLFRSLTNTCVLAVRAQREESGKGREPWRQVCRLPSVLH